jgi:hypothetical protein
VASEVIPAQNGKHVVKLVTPSGVTGIFSSDVSKDALIGLLKKLKQRHNSLQRRRKNAINPKRVG